MTILETLAAEAERPPVADSGPQAPTVQCKLTQSYRIASAVNAGSQTASICNGSGQVELFTIGSDGNIWNVYPDPSSDTGYSSVSLGIQAGVVAAGLDANGHVVVFAATALQLYYIAETGNPANRWGQPTAIQVPQPPHATRIARVLTKQIGGTLYVGVLTAYSSVVPNTVQLAYSQWTPGAPLFTATSFSVGSLHCVWLGNTAQTAAFACVDGTVVSYGIATGAIQHYPMVGTFQSTDVDATTDQTGADQIVAVLADGNAYHLTGGSGGQPYSWAQLSQGLALRQIRAVEDQAGAVQIFGVNGNNRLYHWLPEPANMSGYSYPPAVLQTNVAQLDVALNDAGAIDLFLVGTAHNALTHLMSDETSGNWQATSVEVATNGAVETLTAYTADVWVYDAIGALLSEVPVVIQSSDELQLVVNGATYFVGPGNPINTATLAGGSLTIAQPTSSLGTPSLQVSFPGSNVTGQPLMLHPSADTRATLAATTGPDLMSAQTTGGNYLLAPQYRTKQTTDSLATAINQCMQVSYSTSLGRAATYTGPAQHWQLCFGADGQVSYTALTADTAQAILATKQATLTNAKGFFDWLDDIGDFIEEVVDGIANVVDVVVTTIGNAINAAITFVVDGVTYLFNAVVNLVEQAFDLVETLMAQVGVFFQDLFEWIGFLFNWDDILRTHKAIAYTINQFLGFTQGAVGGIQTIIDNGITAMQGQVDTFFEQVIQDVGGQLSMGGYANANKKDSPAFTQATANNVVYNGLIANASGAQSLTAHLFSVESGPFDGFLNQLTNYIATVENIPAFSKALMYFQQMTDSADNIFVNLLSGLLEVLNGVAQAILAGVRAVVDALLGLVQTIIGAFQQMLNEAWNIPFVSAFYSWLTNGSTLTTIDLLALLIAIPATPLYKVIEGVAPFPDDSSVTAFENSFTAQTMLQATGLGGSTGRAMAAGDSGGILPPALATLTAVAGGIAGTVYGWLSALLDAIPKESPPIMSQVALCLESAWQVFTFPWFYTSGAPDCTTPDGTGKTMWIYQILGILLDAGFTYFEERIPENASDLGVWVSFAYAVGHLITGIVVCCATNQTSYNQAVAIITVIPELLKIGRLTRIVAATKGISLIVVAVSDAVFFSIAAIMGIFQSIPPSQHAPLLAPARPVLALHPAY
jgi:hypothetical protein